MNKKLTCANCGESYALTPDKPGRINQCADCGSKVEVERVVGVTNFDGKNESDRSLDIVSKEQFDELKRQRRCGSPLYQGW